MLAHNEDSTSEMKDISSTVLTSTMIKTVDFEHFLLKIFPPRKCFYSNMCTVLLNAKMYIKGYYNINKNDSQVQKNRGNRIFVFCL